MVAAIGFLIIPAKRRRAKADLDEKISALRRKLADALRREFQRARERSAEPRHVGRCAAQPIR